MHGPLQRVGDRSLADPQVVMVMKPLKKLSLSHGRLSARCLQRATRTSSVVVVWLASLVCIAVGFIFSVVDRVERPFLITTAFQ